VALSDQLGVSRATVRTALHHLVTEGLAIQVPYTGWMVVSMTARDARELVTLRSALESLAARLAAETLNSNTQALLDKAYGALRRAVQRNKATEMAAADLALHRTIVAMAQHDRLSSHYRIVDQQIGMLIASSNTLLTDQAQLITQHAPIVTAILDQDIPKAEVAMRLHIDDEGRRLVAHLDASENSIGAAPAPGKLKTNSTASNR
jgi:DNA-binding GntR family transcriptional regulator